MNDQALLESVAEYRAHKRTAAHFADLRKQIQWEIEQLQLREANVVEATCDAKRAAQTALAKIFALADKGE